VIAFKDGRPVDAFLGAIPEDEVQRFVDRLLPTEEESEVAGLLAAGDEVSLRRVLDLEPGNEDAIVALGEILVERGDGEEALALLGRIPESERTRKVAAAARLGTVPDDDHDATLAALLPKATPASTGRPPGSCVPSWRRRRPVSRGTRNCTPCSRSSGSTTPTCS
jgi:putative thioredoxin